jgi:hypothetical protein
MGGIVMMQLAHLERIPAPYPNHFGFSEITSTPQIKNILLSFFPKSAP